MRRILIIVIGLAVAIAFNVVLLLVALISDPVAGDAIIRLVSGLFDAGMAPGQGAIEGEIEIDAAALAGAFSLIWHAVTALCVLPLSLSALLAEAARTRSLAWHMIAPGAIAAAVPWTLRLAFGDPGARDAAQAPVENRFLALFFICAALSGAIYWMIARRRAAGRQR